MFRFEKLNIDNINLLPSLFENAFGGRRELDEILVKYKLHDIYSSYVSFLAFSEETNELAGFYGVLPSKFNYEGQVHLCGQVCDLMTHSNYRRLGLFELMAKEAHNFLQINGFKFVYTFPYEGAVSYFGFVNKLHFKEKSMNSYSLKVFTLPLSKKIQKGFLSSFYSNYLKILFNLLFINRFDSNNSSLEKYQSNQLIHDSYLFGYKRLLSKNNFLINNYEAQSFMKIDSDGALSIGNLSIINANAFKNSIRRLKIFCFLGFIRYIHFEVCSSNSLNGYLLKKTDFKNLYTICYLILDESIDVDKIEFNFIDIDSF
jgi:hypothetical protein